MGILTVISQVGTIIQTVIEIKKGIKDNKQIKILNSIQEKLEKQEKDKIVDRRELFLMLKETTNNDIYFSKSVLNGLFGSYDGLGWANEIVKRQYNNGLKVLEGFEFNENDLTFSSYGTIGFLKQIKNKNTVVVYHSNGLDKGRLFVIRWGIGWYYFSKLNHHSFLGFPTSNEYSTSDKGRTGSRNDFEGGYIEYIKEFDKLRIFRPALNGINLITEHQF